MKTPTVFLTRRATFCAGHRLHSEGLSAEENRRLFGKCNWENGHGHNYILHVSLRGRVDPVSGVVYNLAELKDLMEREVLGRVDHKNLNKDVEEFSTLNPTVENIAVVIWGWLEPCLPKGLLYEVRLQETENNSAFYRGE